MILYTAMPSEWIYQAESSEYAKQKVVNFEGIPLLVELTSGSEYRVIQVMSTDPNDFMNENIGPGVKITLS
ncbi:YlzJ-like family protein [Cytobacillus sp. FSL R5-0569]|uniref:YlzJ-like family protein n=1 Tax=Cytobacillus TaxID=2675230 RepID=UPI00277F0F56|nr:YlzJ-like family protein [Cytobacillus kochii]MDQ0184767.1 hypothetical protein [Cytobacillus kochii]